MHRTLARPLGAALGVALCLALGTGCATDDVDDPAAADQGVVPPPAAAGAQASLAVCAGCGVARSADFTVIQHISPHSPTTARSADFTMELLAAPRSEDHP